MKKLTDWVKEKLLALWGAVYFIVLNHSAFAIRITNILKEVAENKSVNAYVTFTKNNIDDKVLALVTKSVKLVGVSLQIVKENETLEDAFDTVLTHLNQLPDYGKGILLREISGAIAKARAEDSPAGKKVSIGEFIAIVQLLFKEKLSI